MARSSQHSNKVILGILGLASMAFFSSYSLGANNLAGLRNIDIRSYGDFTIDPGEKLLMTLEGDYATYSVPVQGAWRITEGSELGWLPEHCDSHKTCEFQAGDQGGTVKVYVSASGFSDEASITIRKPAAPKIVDNPFSDSIPDWAGEPIVELKERQVIQGYEDGRYGAGDLLTRGQLITIFYRTLVNMKLVTDSCNSQEYKDVPPGHYAFEAACVFQNEGWTDSLSTLDVNQPVTRGETASILNRVVGYTLLNAKDLTLGGLLADGKVYSDIPVSHVFFADTAVTRAIGIMRGNPDGRFEPARTLNRAEAATIFWRTMSELQNERVRSL